MFDAACGTVCPDSLLLLMWAGNCKYMHARSCPRCSHKGLMQCLCRELPLCCMPAECRPNSMVLIVDTDPGMYALHHTAGTKFPRQSMSKMVQTSQQYMVFSRQDSAPAEQHLLRQTTLALLCLVLSVWSLYISTQLTLHLEQRLQARPVGAAPDSRFWMQHSVEGTLPSIGYSYEHGFHVGVVEELAGSWQGYQPSPDVEHPTAKRREAAWRKPEGTASAFARAARSQKPVRWFGC